MILLKLGSYITPTGTISFIKLLFHIFSGRDPFPLFLKKNKLPRKFSISQPGELGDSDYYKESDFEVNIYYNILSHL